jgi:hypothetical protein
MDEWKIKEVCPFNLEPRDNCSEKLTRAICPFTLETCIFKKPVGKPADFQKKMADATGFAG